MWFGYIYHGYWYLNLKNKLYLLYKHLNSRWRRTFWTLCVAVGGTWSVCVEMLSMLCSKYAEQIHFFILIVTPTG